MNWQCCPITADPLGTDSDGLIYRVSFVVVPARKQGLGGIEPLSPSLVLKYASESHNHIMFIRVLVLLLKLKGHGGKHEIANIK